MEDFQATGRRTEEHQHAVNIDISRIVSIDEGRTFTTSLVLAQVFEKNHFDVLKAVKNLECSQEFTDRNFTVSEYTDSTGRTLPAYHLTRDGFSFLAMGFTGSKAAAWKEKFLDAFNAMERTLRERQQEESTAPLPRMEPKGISAPTKAAVFLSQRRITQRQREALIGALHAEAYWQECSFDEAEARLLTTMNLKKLENLEQRFWMDAACNLIRRFFLVRSAGHKLQGVEEARKALQGMMDLWAMATGYYTKKDIGNYVLNWCGITSIDEISTENDMRKALFAAWGGFSKHALDKNW